MRKSLLQRLVEAGRVLSKANESKLRDAATRLQEVLASVAGGLPMNEAQRAQFQDAGMALLEAELSFDAQRQAVQKALRTATERSCYVRDMYDTWLVYDCYDSQIDTDRLYRVSYVVDDQSQVTFGQPVEVIGRMVYEPIAALQESGDALPADVVPLVEKAVRRDGTVPIKVIAPGWGSTGYYAAAVLERDGAAAFPKGTHMYWNHPTTTEEVERPERDLRDLAAVLESAARWEADGADGPGLYADARVMPAYTGDVEALAEHIGTSIHAFGKARMGEAEGRSGVLIEQIVPGGSIDFVTKPGAGGKVLQLFEAAGRRSVAALRPTPIQEDLIVTNEEATALKESVSKLEQENARLKEAQILREARDLVQVRLAAIDMPELTRARLTEALAKRPVLTDGAIDVAAFNTAIDEAAASELEYLQQATGAGAGQIRGMGGSAPTGGDVDVAGLQESLATSFAALGLSESASKIAAAGR